MFGRATPEAVRLPYREYRRSPACASCRRRSPRSIPRRGASRPTPAPTRPTCWSSRSAPTTTSTRRRGSPRRATSSTRSRAPSGMRRAAIAAFSQGRAVVGVCGAPFKCPPAPSECALLLHDYLVDARRPRRLRDHPRAAVRDARCRRRRRRLARSDRRVRGARDRVRPRPQGERARPRAPRRRARRRQRAAYDLFLGVPKHRAPDVVVAERPDRGRLRARRLRRRSRRGSRASTPSATSRPRGRRRPACSPKARRASSPTSLIARLRGDGTGRRPRRAPAPATSSSAPAGSAASTSTSSRGRRRPAMFQAPSIALRAEKQQFGASRRARWFGQPDAPQRAATLAPDIGDSRGRWTTRRRRAAEGRHRGARGGRSRPRAARRAHRRGADAAPLGGRRGLQPGRRRSAGSGARRSGAARRRRRRERDEAVLAETGIRVLREQPVFTTPNVFPPAGFEQADVDDEPEFREVDRAAALLRLQAALRRDPPVLRPALPGVRRLQLRKRDRDRRPARPRRAAHRRAREDRLPGRASSCCAPART